MALRYISTRGRAPTLTFADVLLAGLASDGGLYCPETLPPLPLSDLGPDADYVDVARAVMWPFVDGTIDREVFEAVVADAYRGFRHADVVPLVELGEGLHLLDLTKGPTLAFKDIALQLVGRLLDLELERRHQHATVLAATSGDTGSAAIEALQGRANVGVAVLHPDGRVSDVQRRQMTTVDAPNVCNIAVAGSFDDCQDLVKAAFNETDLRAELGLAAVNSINWARVMAQIVYYVAASMRLTAGSGPVSFCVPTGNFGNVLAGWYASRMGLPVDQLVVATNRNDILSRFFRTGWLVAEPVQPSLSPSMDIQISSNFERMLWEAAERDSDAIAALLEEFRRSGSVEVPGPWHDRLVSWFSAGRADDEETLQEIKRVHDELGMLVDPHTAVGLKVASELRRDHRVPMVVLATADPAKFPDAVEQATGVRPALPPFLAELHARPERYERAPAELDAVIDLVRQLPR